MPMGKAGVTKRQSMECLVSDTESQKPKECT